MMCCIFFGFKRRRRQDKGEQDKVNLLLNCLHLIIANATTRFVSKVSTSLENHDC